MSKYDLQQLVTMWQKEKITTEQAIGQLLLHFQGLVTRVGTIERHVESNRKETVALHQSINKKGKQNE